MKPTIIVPAIGLQYEQEAARLKRSLPDAIVIDRYHHAYEQQHAHPLCNGLMVKAGFGSYLPDAAAGPVLLCDADLHSNDPDPLRYLSIPEQADIACVPYGGRWFYPDPDTDAVSVHFGRIKLNTGFVYFRDASLADRLSQQWVAIYRDRVSNEGVPMERRLHEMDEIAFMMAVRALDLNVHPLEPEWNDWDGRTAAPVFRHSHLAMGDRL